MDLTLITTQLRYEVTRHVTKETQSPTSRYNYAAQRTHAVQVAQTQALVDYVYYKLYDIMKRNNIHFKNKVEEEGFISYLEPTINNLIIHHIKD